MAIHYQICETRGVVFTCFDDAVNAIDVFDHQQRLAGDRAFRPHYREYIDVRNTRLGKDINFRSICAMAEACPWGSEAQRAVVTSSHVVYGISQIFALVMGKTNGTIALFREMQPAIEWLGIESVPDPIQP